MKCDHCDNEATVHEVTVRNGVKIEKHVCESCAVQYGLAVQAPGTLSEFMTKFMATPAQPGAIALQQRAGACPTCRMTFAEFRQGGLLGCPDCYRAFEAQLGPLIERAHEGGLKHAGKHPLRAGGNMGENARRMAAIAERADRLKRVREELERAVVAEQYEKAAQLRDELRRLQQSEG